MKLTIQFSFIYMFFCISCTHRYPKNVDTNITSIDTTNKSDTIYKDQKTLIIKSGNSFDTLARFNPRINDTIYSVQSEAIKLKNKLDFSKYEYKKMFITRIKEDVERQGVNFAGHFCFVNWGCGSPCKLSAVIDIKTGIVYNGVSAETGYEFKSGSTLLIVNPPDSTGWYSKTIIWHQPSQFIWTGKSFIEVKK